MPSSFLPTPGSSSSAAAFVGCSTAYHLTKIGHTDVVLLERKVLGCGTTWAAAGLVAQLRQNREMTNLAKYATSSIRRWRPRRASPPAT